MTDISHPAGALGLGPAEIESRSFAIIQAELGETGLPPGEAAVLTRVIHASADFDYRENLRFSPGALAAGIAALRAGQPIVTDTEMARAGINREAAAEFGCDIHCFIRHPEVREAASRSGLTRSRAAVDLALRQGLQGIYLVGNAPSALLRILELHQEGQLTPRLVVGVPVGFVEVVESKERLQASPLPHITCRGRKGGSSIAVAIINAMLRLAASQPEAGKE